MAQAVEHHKIAIIGSGFSGLGMAIKLKQSGENDFVVFEKEGGVGGTWRVNHYPGCACDVPSHLYSFSFASNPTWTRMFAPQPEIKNYLEHCAEKFTLMPHVRLNNAVTSARWDEDNTVWRIQDQHGKQHTATMIVAGTGGLSTPSYPNLNGVERFEGTIFHSQDWNHEYDLTGKRVAVIGTGASAIQFVPHVQKQAKKVDLYQRTAPWVMSKPDRAMSWAERNLFKRLPAAQNALRKSIYWMLESRVLGFTVNPRLMVIAKRWALNHIRAQITDPELRKKVTPDYTIGCKRILMSDDYYPALDQPNAEVVTTGIQEIKANSIVTVDGEEREVDAIIYGTGFAATSPVPKGVIHGRDGVDLVDSWKDGPEAYKGTTISGFPNLFMLMGPNTGLGHNSMVYMIESQITYVLDAMKKMRKENIGYVDVLPEVQATYNEAIQRKTSGSVWNSGGCQSWYLHPETGKNVTLWPDFTWKFRLQTRQFDTKAYYLQPAITSHSNITTPNTTEATA
ncbi:4-hydroxyacetophenone monooxygenase [Gammaproteobacteria bacterium 45_16_T64]|nr:4-hydroxyacetophenone monooxygenase [Gammaproteobacteria bacterium 45_16_T64]